MAKVAPNGVISPPGYQGYDKAMDVYYLAIAYTSTLRNWTSSPAFAVSRFLYFYRLVGVTAFELSGWRPLLLIFPTQPRKEPTILSRLAAKHGRTELKVDPTWFPIFLESLVHTAGQHDPEFTPTIADAWREALKPGMTYMQRYAEPSGTQPR